MLAPDPSRSRGSELGLLRMAARTAVVAGTATAVHGRVQRRQAERWEEQDAQQYAQQQPQYQQASPEPQDDATAQLQNLANLHAQGVLTDEEFAAAKAKILGI
jgi:membrane protease subunit (stomatin/prohibitin family)